MNHTATNKVLIMAGGTGGHVFPALTIAEELLARGCDVEWLGTRQGIEATVIGSTAIPLHYITVSGLRGSNWLRKLIAPVVVGLAVLQAMLKINQIKPSCVLGMGGFATGPGGVAARLLRKPLLIHEQNAIAGLTNYLLHPLATVVMEGFAGAFVRKRRLIRFTAMQNWVKAGEELVVGNPVRAQLSGKGKVAAQSESASRPFRLLILGGSLGAVAINNVIPGMLKLFADKPCPEVLHQCGRRNLGATLAAYHDCGLSPSEQLKVVPFIDDMAAAYQWADMIVCRSGASTVAELVALGIPAILIPYKYAVDDHQTENARIMVNAGAAQMIVQDELTAANLYGQVSQKMSDPAALEEMTRAAATLVNPDSARLVADKCQEACNG